MFSEFFKLEENPFGETPNTRFYFDSKSHRNALKSLDWVVRDRKGFGLLTGEVGTGKTLVCRILQKSLERSASTALVLFPYLNEAELIKTICEEFGVSVGIGANKTFKDYLDRLNQFLIRNALDGKRSVLMIDEAQKLSLKNLEVIRLLTNLETEQEKLLQILLISQPEIKNKLATHHLRQFAQRVAIHCELKPFSLRETESYIHHRLERAGAGNLVRFDSPAVKLIWSKSKGLPRLINRYCEIVLLSAEANRVRLIELKFAQAILESKKKKSYIKKLFSGEGLFG